MWLNMFVIGPFGWAAAGAAEQGRLRPLGPAGSGTPHSSSRLPPSMRNFSYFLFFCHLPIVYTVVGVHLMSPSVLFKNPPPLLQIPTVSLLNVQMSTCPCFPIISSPFFFWPILFSLFRHICSFFLAIFKFCLPAMNSGQYIYPEQRESAGALV